jgi:CRISPR-associated endonuclease/helicase Cas3
MSKPDFQSKTRELLKNNKSVLLVAPTGIGKTRAVTSDLEEKPTKIIYAVPLRALGIGIRNEICQFRRNGTQIDPKIHHGDTQESHLFGEEVVVTTYDQVVCGTPGLPLSLSLRAGHAVAGALLMSRLILDEAHLAWGISPKALSILLGIIDFRTKLGLQTVLQTATLPTKIAQEISKQLGMELLIVGEDDLSEDPGLMLREKNRRVDISRFELGTKGKGDQKQLDFGPLDEKLLHTPGKRIYFANTIERLQQTYDRLLKSGLEQERVIVLHNRMPRSWRNDAEIKVLKYFGKASEDGNWVLLTNQVAEAGLDISAPLVISDPAPVDTLVQRAGRCARWFRTEPVSGQFFVISAAKNYIEDVKKGLALPYRKDLVQAAQAALDSLPNQSMNWQNERHWVDKAWGGDPEKAVAQVQAAIDDTAFALNLFDRAAQESSPGVIANAFREILSAEIAVADSAEIDDLQKFQQRLDRHEYPETSSVSLRRAWGLVNNRSARTLAIRYEEGAVRVESAAYARPGDVLIVSSDVAVLHRQKGLCFLDPSAEANAIKQSNWQPNKRTDENASRENGRAQGLFEHTKEVMGKTYEKLSSNGCYRDALLKILKSLEPENAESLAAVIAQMAAVAAGFHDLGKADREWQRRAAEIEPRSDGDLIGRTGSRNAHPIGKPHTPPAFTATLAACRALIGDLGSAEHLARCIALAAARHHSSLTNPDMPNLPNYVFEPHVKAKAFIEEVLREINADETALKAANEILQAATRRPKKEEIPLALPNDDLFPIYALVGRAILVSDRESASGKKLEDWSA